MVSAQDSNTFFQKTRLIFAGDVMQHKLQLDEAKRDDGTYSYSHWYRHITEEVKKADIAIANLETPIYKEGFNGYPSFCAPDSFLYAIRDAGFNTILFANNHCLDKGKRGALHTLNLLDSLGISHCGVYRNIEEREERYPLIIDSNGVKVAILNYTYGTNGNSIPAPIVVNLIDKPTIEEDIFKAKSKGADVIIACMHWGDEYVRIAPKRVHELSQWLIEQGVDHIIGNHPHIIQPIEIREDTDTPDKHAVAYSTGNLVSNMSLRGTDGGLMIRMELKKILNYTRISSFEYFLTWIAPKKGDGSRDFTILPASSTRFINNSNAEKRLRQFLDDTKELFLKHNRGDIKEFISDSVVVTP
ncbi:MAG: CapA family protein [Bacteroidaceae bacterium]|nr:CapA family protein [Bacteroidaceae bacterium]